VGVSDLLAVGTSPDFSDANVAYRSSTGAWYFKTPSAFSWKDSQLYAFSHGGNLVTVESADTNTWLQSKFSGDFWIGYYRDFSANAWRWVSGSTATYTNWLSGQPGTAADQLYAFANNGGWSSATPGELKFGLYEVKTPPVEVTASTVPEPSATHRLQWSGRNLATGRFNANIPDQLSTVETYVDDRDSSNTATVGDEFVMAELVSGDSGVQTRTLARRTLSGIGLSASYAVASGRARTGATDFLVTGEPDGQLFTWSSPTAGTALQSRPFSILHIGKSWHALERLGIAGSGDGLVGLRVDPASPQRTDIFLWLPRELDFAAAPVIQQTVPLVRVLPTTNSGGANSQIDVRLWDSEGNPSRIEVQFQNPSTGQWQNATLLSIDGQSVSAGMAVSALPQGVTHQIIWNAAQNLGSGYKGSVSVRVRGSDAFGSGTWSDASLYTVDLSEIPTAIISLSSRLSVEINDRLVVPFRLEGVGGKTILIRAVGPGLVSFGLAGAMSDPKLRLLSANGTEIGNNDDWNTPSGNTTAVVTATATVGAYPLASGSKDAALCATLNPGSYIVEFTGNGPGILLVELYDIDVPIHTSRLTYLGLFGPAGAGTSIQINGFVTSGNTARDFLLRAVGPSLGLSGCLADPQLALYDNNGMQLAINDNWGGTPTLQGLFSSVGAPSWSANSLDAALTAQFASTMASHTALVSGPVGATGSALFEVYDTANRTPPTSPVLLIPAASQTVALGQSTRFEVFAAGVEPLSYQWRKNGADIIGATSSAVSLTNTVAADSGDYTVAITNSAGTLTSAAATLVVNPPAIHAADTNGDFRISLPELTRVIELYNTRLNTARTGRYKVQAGSEDGFAQDPAATANQTLTRYHSADSNRDGQISLGELTRVIELYNYRVGTTRTGQYHVQAGTEDGFAPGP